MNESEVRRIAAQEAALVVQAFYRVFANQLGGDVEAAGKAADAIVEAPRPPGYYAVMDRRFAFINYGFPPNPWHGQDHKADDGGTWTYQLPTRPHTEGQWEAMNYPPTGDPYLEVKAAERAAAPTVPAEVSVTPTVLTPSVGLDPDVALIMRNAADGIDSWLNGGLCRDVTYWESVRHRLHAEARRQTVQTFDRANADIDTMQARLNAFAAGEMFPQSQKQQK